MSAMRERLTEEERVALIEVRGQARAVATRADSYINGESIKYFAEWLILAVDAFEAERRAYIDLAAASGVSAREGEDA